MVGLAASGVRFTAVRVAFGLTGVEEATIRLAGALPGVGTLAERWEVRDEEHDEFALAADDGLIERLRVAVADAEACCNPGAIGRGIKPTRGC